MDRDDIKQVLSQLDGIKNLVDEIQEHPLRLLLRLRDQQAYYNGPVPDYAMGYLSVYNESVVRALIDGGYINRKPSKYSIFEYTLTDEGCEIVKQLSR